MERNIKLLYVFRVLRTFTIFAAILLPFTQKFDISQTQFFLLQSLFAVTILVLEIPSGILADSKGRKSTLIVGSVLVAMGFGFYAAGSSYLAFIIAELLLGAGYSFLSGADEALAYDSYLVIEAEATAETSSSKMGAALTDHELTGYQHFEAKANGYAAFSEASASVLGGLLAIISIRAPLIAQVGVNLLIIPIAFLIVEPEVPKSKLDSSPSEDPEKEKLSVSQVAKQVLLTDSTMRWLVLYGAVVGTLTHTVVWLFQPYYQLVGIPIGWFGVLWAGQSLLLGIFSKFSPVVQGNLGRRQTLKILPIIGVASYVLLAVRPSLISLVAIVGFFFVRGVQVPMLRQATNELISSDIRATALSINNLVRQLLYAGLGPLVGLAVDIYSLRTALFISAVFYSLLTVPLLLTLPFGSTNDARVSEPVSGDGV